MQRNQSDESFSADAWVARLEFGDEAILAIRDALRLECQAVAAARGAPEAVLDRLCGVVDQVLLDGMHDLCTVGSIIACGTSRLSVRLVCDPKAYRRLAESAKDRVIASLI